jgi:hypothetical protein
MLHYLIHLPAFLPWEFRNFGTALHAPPSALRIRRRRLAWIKQHSQLKQ